MSATRFSIASMFLLTMVVAVVVGAVVQSVQSVYRAPAGFGGGEGFVVVGGIVLGMIAGIVVALTHCRWFVAIPIGGPAGLVIGSVIGLLIAVPAGLPVLLAGCPLVLLYAVAVRFLSRPEDRAAAWPDWSVPAWDALARRKRSGQPWGARWDAPATGVPRRFGIGVLMLLVTLSAVLFSALQTIGVWPEVFAVISSMVVAVAIGQVFLFGGRYPRAASIWVGSCFAPLQAIALCLWAYFEPGSRWSVSIAAMLVVALGSAILSAPLGAAFGYLSGGLVGGVFLTLDALTKWRRSRHDAGKAAAPPETPPKE
jgi:MFS family permease